jgi:hypothetical protein
MPKLRCLIGWSLLFSLNGAWADTLTLPTETPTNAAAFTINVDGYRGSSPTVFELLGTIVEAGEINIYASVSEEGFAVPSGYDETVQIGPFPSGSYTVNYYLYTKYGENAPFSLADSKSLEISKSSDNQPATGRIEISGETTEDQLLTATPNVSDLNGVGALSYQWYRNGKLIPGAVFASHLLTDDDVGATHSVTVSFEDGEGNSEQISSLRTMDQVLNVEDEAVGSVYVRGSVVEGEALTVDSSSLYDEDATYTYSLQWERRSRSFSVAGERIGTDSDTYSPTADDVGKYLAANAYYLTGSYRNKERVVVAESINTGQVVSADHAVVIPPDDLTFNATGTLTQVDVGMATAQDDQGAALETYLKGLVSNGAEQPLPTDPGQILLPPGTHLLTWSVHDGESVSAEAIQIVRVDPIVQFAGDRSASPSGPYSCPLALNGAPARYPVAVPYTLSAVLAADQSQQTLYQGTLNIDGREQPPTIHIPEYMVAGAAEYQSLLLTMDQPTNGVMGDKTTCRIVLSSENFTPQVSLVATQDNQPHRLLAKDNGQVTVTSSVVDLNVDDTYSFDWSGTDQALTDIDDAEASFTFDPQEVAAGLYHIRLRVSDGSSIGSAVLTLLVVDDMPQLSAESDIDGDGLSDNVEGSGDQDGDGIPDYLDHGALMGNVLAQDSAHSAEYLIETEAGLTLSLGEMALYSHHDGAMISSSDLQDYISDGLGRELDSDEYRYEAGLFDFCISGMAKAGASVRVVIPQQQMIAADSVYRKQMPTGWQVFVVDSANTVKSAPGEAGRCPAPGDSAYVDGLNQGDWCVQLTIQDGGPNDADGETDGAISDPGGVATAVTSDNGTGDGSSDNNDTGDGSNETGNQDTGDSSGGGGGAITLWSLFLLLMVLFGTTLRGRIRSRFS